MNGLRKSLIGHRLRGVAGWALVCFFLVTTPVASGDPFGAAIEELLDRQERPTIDDLLSKLSPWPETNPFHSPSERRKTHRDYLDLMKKHGPRLIAQFEAAFPGGVYAPLGRDVVMIGDMMDAFYRGIGQTGRVKRINASRKTLKAAEPMLVEFLAAHGFDASRPGPQPFIIFDTSGYRRTSQLRKLLRAGYRAYHQTGGKSADLRSLFNGVRIGGLARLCPDCNKARQVIAEDLESWVVEGHEPESLYAILGGYLNHPQILRYGEMQWHAPFGHLRRNPRRGMIAAVGKRNPRELRNIILHHLYEIVELTRAPAFRAAVGENANGLGYNFWAEQESRSSAASRSFDFDREAVEYSELVSGLSKVSRIKRDAYLSPGAQEISTWFDQRLPAAQRSKRGETFVSLFLEGVLAARAENRVSARDLRRLVAHGLAALDRLVDSQPSVDFVAWFQRVYANDPYLADVWNQRSAYFLSENPHRRGGLAVVRMYNHLSDQVKDVPDTTAACSSKPFRSAPRYRQNLLGEGRAS